MAVCAAAGHDVRFVYYEAEDTYLGKTSHRPSYKQISDDICHTEPDIVAFSCVTDNYQHQLQCSRALKKKQKHIATIFGGVHPTALPENTLLESSVDAVAIGEAERSLVELLNTAEVSGTFSFPDDPIRGIIFKKYGASIGVPVEGKLAKLDSLPFPYKQPFLSVLRDSSHEYRIMTSRGCLYHCSYCFNSYMRRLRGSKAIRRRSIDNVIEELLLAKKEFAVKRIMFVDDSFAASKTWVSAFCAKYRANIGLPFACIANPNHIDEETSGVLASAGCVNVQLGIQSLSESICAQVLDRKSSNAQIGRAIQHLKKSKIMVQVDHLLGIPGDTVQVQEASVRFYNTYRPNLISIFWLTYYPKTTIVGMAQNAGVITQSDINSIEQGFRLTPESYLTGGSLRNPKPYFSISFLLNWLPLLPGWFVTILLRSRVYRLFRIRNYLLSTALPRVIQSVFNKNDFRGRSHIVRFFGKALRIKKGSKVPNNRFQQTSFRRR